MISVEITLSLMNREYLREEFEIIVKAFRAKTIKISNNKKKESITKAFFIEGQISGTPESIAILYYKGLGSKTSLGLGCWRVSNE